MTHALVKQAQEDLERELGAHISWAGMYLHLWGNKGDVSIFSMRFEDEKSQKNIVSARTMFVDFRLRKYVAHLIRTRISESSMAQRRELLPLSFLSSLTIREGELHYEEAYQSFYAKSSEKLFGLKRLPHDATISIENSQLRVLWNDHSVVSKNVRFTARLVEATSSIIFDIDSALTLDSTRPSLSNALSKEVTIDLASRISTQDFFENFSVDTTVRGAHVGDIVSLNAFDVVGDVTPQYARFFARLGAKNIAEGVFDREQKTVAAKFHANKFPLHTLVTFSEKTPEVFSELSDDLFFLQGDFVYDAANVSMRYALELQNEPVENTNSRLSPSQRNLVRFKLSGNERVLHAQDITMKIGGNFFSWQGSLALKTIAPSGSVRFTFDKFLMDKPLQGSFVLKRSDNLVSGQTRFLAIDSISQPSFSFRYDSEKKSTRIFLGETATPVFSLLKDQSVNRWHVILQNIPVKFIAALLPHVYQKPLHDVFDDLEAGGKIAIYPSAHAFMSAAEYTLALSSVKQENFRAHLVGVYSAGVWSVKNASLKLPTVYNTVVTADGEYDSAASTLAMLVRVKNSTHKKALEYSLQGSVIGKDSNAPTWKLAVNKKAALSVQSFGNQTAAKRIDLDIKTLLLPFANLRVQDTSVSAVYHENAITQFDGALHVAREHTKQFAKTKFRFVNDEIRIASFHLASSKKAIKAHGEIKKENGLWRVSLRKQTNAKDTSHEFVHGSYDTNAKTMYVSLRNIDTQLFFPKVSGLVNFDFTAVNNLSEYTISAQNSSVAVDNVPIIFSGSVNYKNGLFSFRDILVTRNSMRLYVYDLRMQDAQNVFGTYGVSSDRNANILLKGTLDLATKEKLTYANLGKRVVPQFSGRLTTEVYYSQSSGKQDVGHKYALTVENTEEVFSIFEEKNRFFLIKRNNGMIDARLGDENTSFYITLNGSVLPDIVDLNMRVIKANFAPLLEQFGSSSIQKLNVTGRLSVRGTPSSPAYYGFLQARNTEFRTTIFSKTIIVPKTMVLFSENNISIANTRVNIGSGRIGVIAKGRLVNNSIQDFTINVHIDERHSVQVKKLSIGKVNLTGMVHGDVTVVTTNPSPAVEIRGDVYLGNTDVVFESGQVVQKNLERAKGFSVDITVHSHRGVVFIMPTINFPILRGYLANNQELRFEYEGDTQNLRTNGTVAVDGGQVYYFNKGFTITNARIIFNDENPVSNPYLVNLRGQRREYYRGNRYTLQLVAENTPVLNMDVEITANPSLASSEIAGIIANDAQQRASEYSSTNNSDSGKLLTGLVNFSDPLSNIGVFSRFEQLLRRSLQLDYIAFNTKIAQRILEYSLDREAAFRQGLQSSAFLDAIPYFFTGSSLEIGKYVKDLYLSFALKINNNSLFTNTGNFHTMPTIGVNTVFNVELPTPIFNVRWSFDPTLLFNQIQSLPVSFLTISYQLQY